MQVNQFESPSGLFKVTVNGQSSDFRIIESDYNTYYIDNEPMKCTNVYVAVIDILHLNIGDKILCEFENGLFHNDGGGELMSNIIAEFNDYTVGMGVYEVEEDKCYQEQLYPSLTPKFTIPYVNLWHTNKGFEFEIVDYPRLYIKNKNDTKITVILAWESNNMVYAYDIVGFLTS